MKDLIIVGAGGLGREVLQMCLEINCMASCWNIRGFINDDLQALNDHDYEYPVLGKIIEGRLFRVVHTYSESQFAKFLVANGITE